MLTEACTKLTKQGMALIESLDAAGFAAYLKAFKNTICGRHPIAVLLQVGPHASLPALPSPTCPLPPLL